MEIPQENASTVQPIDNPAESTVGVTAVQEPTQTDKPIGPIHAVPPPRNKGGRPRGSKSHRRNPSRRVDRPVLTPRLSCFTRDDGTIDFDRTNDDTIDKLKRAIQTPEAQRRLGLVDGAGQQLPPRSWAGMTGTLVDAVNAIAVQAAVNHWQLTDDQAALLLLRRKPETHAGVVALTGEVLDKYFPGGFGAYDKEISLLILLGGFVAESVQAIAALRTTPTAAPNYNASAAA